MLRYVLFIIFVDTIISRCSYSCIPPHEPNNICNCTFDDGSEIILSCTTKKYEIVKNLNDCIKYCKLICHNNKCYVPNCKSSGEYCEFDCQCCSNICYNNHISYSFCR